MARCKQTHCGDSAALFSSPHHTNTFLQRPDIHIFPKCFTTFLPEVKPQYSLSTSTKSSGVWILLWWVSESWSEEISFLLHALKIIFFIYYKLWVKNPLLLSLGHIWGIFELILLAIHWLNKLFFVILRLQSFSVFSCLWILFFFKLFFPL